MPINVGGYEIDSFEARQHQYDGIVRYGLVLQLDAGIFNTVTGTTWYDLSGNSNSGTLTNGPTFSSGNGGSIVFDGANDYIAIGDKTSLRLGSAGSMCSWVNLTSGGLTFQQIMGKRSTGAASGFDYMLDLSSTGRNLRGLISNGSSFNIITGGTTLNYNTWYFVCFIWNGSNLYVYLNSSSDATAVSQTVTPQSTTKPFDIAIARDPTSKYFKGNISMSMVYNRALSSTEITQNYNALKGRYGL